MGVRVPATQHSGTLKLDSFMIVDRDATREEVQDAAFRGTEEKFLPYFDHWVDLAAIEAMEQEGTAGKAFVPFLEKLVADKWSGEDLSVAAEDALAAIKG